MRRFLCGLLSFCLTLSLFSAMAAPAMAAALPDINDPSVFVYQGKGTDYCTITAQVMVMRRKAILEGNENWKAITINSAKKVGWVNNVGVRSSYTYTHKANGKADISITMGEVYIARKNETVAEKTTKIKAQLKKHPEGIGMLLWNESTGATHAVTLTSYTEKNGVTTFYCVDPAIENDKPHTLVKSTLAGKSYSGKKSGATQSDILKHCTILYVVKKSTITKTVTEEATSVDTAEPIAVFSPDPALEADINAALDAAAEAYVNELNAGNTTSEPTPAVHVHDLIQVAAVAATCTEVGNLAYWYCEDCDTCFADASANLEIDSDQVILDPLGHLYADGVCVRCGEPDPEYVAPVAGEDIHFEKQTLYFHGQFTDVPTNQWFTSSVADAYEFGLMKGDSDSTFNPYGDVTLAEAITMAARIHAIYTNGYESFVQTGTWYQVYLDYAYQNGIISRAYYNADVTRKATRAQFATIFANALPDEGLYPINTITDNAVPDVSISESYAPYVYKLYRAGILTGGDSLGTFSPGTYITRAEAAAIVSRMAESDNRVSFTLN